MIKLSVIFPVHNEAGGISRFLSGVFLQMNHSRIPYEILCVENGSTDESYQILRDMAKKKQRLVVIRSSRGWGNAVRTGIAQARGEYVCFMVSDGQIDPSHIVRLYRRMERLPRALVKVWRKRRENAARLLVSRAYNQLVRILLGIGSRDINATPKLLKTSLARSLDLTSPNFAFDLELLWKLKNRGYRWEELSVESCARLSGTSTTKMATVIEAVRAMVGFRLNVRSSKDSGGSPSSMV